MSYSIAERLANNLGDPIKEPYGNALLVIPENSISNLFAERFDIKDAMDLNKFHQAFRICTEGQGNELKSINNVISSALLPLLTFFRLFGKNSGYTLNLRLDDSPAPVVFDRCFFEVRNSVIKLPSCVDVALYSSDSKVMLFLESKLSEYNRVSNDLKIKHGYAELYNDEKFREILNHGDIIVEGDKLKLKSRERAYFEGLKQTISHLIGLVQGPSQNRKGVYYPSEYLNDYVECYNKANTIYYSTIILDPKEIGVLDLDGSYKNYLALYKDTIGDNGKEIIECIRHWCKLKNDTQKKISILKEALSYHKIFKENISLLLPTVRKFYQL